MEIREHVSLHKYTTFKLGGLSRYFAHVESIEDLIDAVTFAKSHNVPFFILGGGSNILVRDEGFQGLTVHVELKGRKVTHERDKVRISISAGERWDDVVAWAVEKGLYGIENLSGIPGSVGAAPIQNIGAYGVEVREVVESVEALDSDTMKVVTLSNDECRFNYRDSIFKQPEGESLIVVRVNIELKKGGSLRTDYKDIKCYFKKRSDLKPNLKTLRQAVLEIRAGKFPDLRVVGTAGSFFKNPTIARKEFDVIQEQYPEIPYYTLENGTVKLPLAWILEHICNMKGMRSGNVGTFERQPLVLVHYGMGSTKEVQVFAKKIQQQVKEKTNIEITPEVTYI